MTTTTTSIRGHRIGRAPTVADRRGAVRRPVAECASWIVPLMWMTALALLVAGAGAFALLRNGVPSGSSTTISVRVSPSDTLWSIAKANRLPGVSTAATVEAITRANDLSGGSIRPGTVLQVPAAEAPPVAFAQAGADSPVR
jgi:Tfp pilus assembly protein FimV